MHIFSELYICLCANLWLLNSISVSVQPIYYWVS